LGGEKRRGGGKMHWSRQIKRGLADEVKEVGQGEATSDKDLDGG